MPDNIIHKDEWIWGTESILWGYDPSHQYTFKILQPKKGRQGCLSLQYHNVKSESWFQYSGVSWALLIVDNTVCTRVLRSGDIQNISTGVIHRLMAVTDDCKVLEPSTPDKHAADKSIPKDVVRLHCILGREVSSPKSDLEKQIVDSAIKITEEAISAVEAGEIPKEYNSELLKSHGAYTLRS